MSNKVTAIWAWLGPFDAKPWVAFMRPNGVRTYNATPARMERLARALQTIPGRVHVFDLGWYWRG